MKHFSPEQTLEQPEEQNLELTGVESFEKQEEYQAPPQAVPTDVLGEAQDLRKRKQLIWLVAGMTMCLVFLLSMLLISGNPTEETTGALPTTTPIPTIGLSSTEQALQTLSEVIQKADPSLDPFAPPPVDMAVEF